MRRFFWFFNKFFMVPVFLLGFGPFFGNPLTGYIMVLKTKGRKTGKLRYSPVNYVIQDGKVYFLSGYRHVSDWYHNLLNQPSIEVIMPSGAIQGTACEVTDQALRTPLIRKILKNAGFAGFMEGFNPFRIGDEELASATADLPMLCLQPNGLGNGASDAGGWAWLGIPAITILLFILLRLIFR